MSKTFRLCFVLDESILFPFVVKQKVVKRRIKILTVFKKYFFSFFLIYISEKKFLTFL